VDGAVGDLICSHKIYFTCSGLDFCYNEAKMVKLISYIRYLLGGGGLYFALSQAPNDITQAVATATLFAVGIVGVLSFVSHALLHEGDAKMIGFSSKTPSFQNEVGFANLAFGAVAMLSYFQDWGIRANSALLLAYALYLLQAGVLHFVESRKTKKMSRTNLIRAIVTFVFSGMMLYVALRAIGSSTF
jgi:hypothetical protein